MLGAQPKVPAVARALKVGGDVQSRSYSMSSLLPAHCKRPNAALERLAPRNLPKKPADGEAAPSAYVWRYNSTDYGSLRLASAESDGDSLRLSIHITGDEYPDIHQDWQVLCSAVKEDSLSLGDHSALQFLDDHVLLWPHLARRTSTSFYGKAENPLAVIGALYQRHKELVGEWLPFHRFLNSDIALPDLISGGFGMLAEGPEPLVLAYEDVMRTNGFSTSHLDPTKPVYWGGNEWLGQKAPAFVLILDDSYVVAEQFAASPV